MSPLNKIQLDRIRDERRGQIKLAALKVFARRGFKATTITMIAFEAGISEGLIYRYFKSKEELFSGLVVELLEEGKRETENVQNLPGSPLDQLQALTKNILGESNKYAFMFILRTRQDENIPDIVVRLLDQNSEDALLARLVPVFVKGQQAGIFLDGDPYRLLAWYFYIVYSLILDEVDQKVYGLPTADFLIRLLAKSPE